MRFLSVLLLALWPLSLGADCGGVDLRPGLDDFQRAEIAQRLDGVPYTEGNHWTARKGARTIHVIGTMHIGDPRMAPVVDRLAPVIRAADLLMVEATSEDQKALEREMATNPDLAFLSGKTLIDLMPPEEWEALAAAAAARGIPGFMAAKFQPWYLSLLLSVSPCELKAVQQGGAGLDKQLLEIAAEAGVPARSLEHYTTVFDLFAKDPIEEQIAMLRLGVLPDTVSENATATLKAQYFDETHMAALEVSRVSVRPQVDLPPEEFDALLDDFMDLLVRQRNEAWMEPIEAAEGDVIVIAAGSLHLGGEHGLLNMLDQRGYTLERQVF